MENTADKLDLSANVGRVELVKGGDIDAHIKTKIALYANTVIDETGVQSYIGAVRTDLGISIIQCGDPMAVAESAYGIFDRVIGSMGIFERLRFAYGVITHRSN